MPKLPIPSLQVVDFDGIPMLSDEPLFEACGVRVAFTERAGGVSSGSFATMNCAGHVGDDPACVERNRALVLGALGAADAQLVVPNQVHGARIVSVDGASSVQRARAEAQEGADAVVVGVADVAALLNFADCLPLAIVSPSGRFAVVHAGWRGAVAHIAGLACAELARADGCPPSSFNAYIGPHIAGECFEVGLDVKERFAAEFGRGVVCAPRHVSLAGAVEADLVHAGMDAARILDCGICTQCNSERYFSYRASGGACGRHSAVAVRIGRGYNG